MLEVPPEVVDEAVTRLAQQGELVIEIVPDGLERIEACYIPPLYHSEKGAASRLRALIESPVSRLADLRRAGVQAMPHGAGGVELTPQQAEAVRLALTNKVSVLTGGPGTGKTTTLRALIDVLVRTRHRFLLASPTGRAAKRLSEATGQPARTIHRMLGFSPAEHGFTYNEENPLDADLIVIDEVSMLDLVLFYNLLKAIPPDAHLLLVGDVDQLPSVGAGDVLRDVIRGGVPITRLDVIFRQEETSLIIRNAHRINRGETPDTSNRSRDFFMFVEEDPAAAAQLLVEVVKDRIPRKFGLDALEDIQVLAPMYRGPVGVMALNEALQEALNPSQERKAERRLAGRLFRVGDKVIQTRNNYEKDVFNGDIGRVHSFDMTNQQMTVVIDGRFVQYDWSEADELTHAYCISVHRSQGGEYPCVVMPVMTQHYMMLQRNLLYTAVTRARQLVVLVGTRKAVAIAVKNDQVARRWSAPIGGWKAAASQRRGTWNREEIVELVGAESARFIYTRWRLLSHPSGCRPSQNEEVKKVEFAPLPPCGGRVGMGYPRARSAPAGSVGGSGRPWLGRRGGRECMRPAPAAARITDRRRSAKAATGDQFLDDGSFRSRQLRGGVQRVDPCRSARRIVRHSA